MAVSRRKKARQQRSRLVVGFGLSASLAFLAGYRRLESNEERYIDAETETLARIIRSEIGIGTEVQKRHVAWAARNLAEERGETLTAMACSPCGPQGRARPVASLQEATEADRDLAREILAKPMMLDPTGGATHFINPRLQDELSRSGKLPGYKGRSYRKVRRTWMRRYGWQPYYRLGDNLELWGKQKASDSDGTEES